MIQLEAFRLKAEIGTWLHFREFPKRTQPHLMQQLLTLGGYLLRIIIDLSIERLASLLCYCCRCFELELPRSPKFPACGSCLQRSTIVGVKLFRILTLGAENHYCSFKWHSPSPLSLQFHATFQKSVTLKSQFRSEGEVFSELSPRFQVQSRSANIALPTLLLLTSLFILELIVKCQQRFLHLHH